MSESLSKSHAYTAANVDPPTTNVFNTLEKPLHRRKRKLIAPVVNERSMKTFEPKMAEQIDIFINQLFASYGEDPKAPLNMSQRCRWLGLDVVGQLAFGYDLNLQTEETHRYLVHGMMTGSHRLNTYMQFPLLRQFRLEIFFYLASAICGHSFLKTLTKMIQTRVAQDKHAKHDLYSFMVDALGSEGKDETALKEIWTEAIFFLPAGGDTSSTAMSSLFFYLARFPEFQKKLAQELRSAFPTSADIRAGPQLAACRYLRACIDEALRMSPPASGTLWRVQSPETRHRPLVVDGHVVPVGTQVGVSAYSLHHNEEYFPEPFTYDPERWLPENEDRITKAAFVPFSTGSRSCAGKAMAYQEVSLTLARTVWHFEFEQATGYATDAAEFELQDIFTATHDGPYLNFRPRNSEVADDEQ